MFAKRSQTHHSHPRHAHHSSAPWCPTCSRARPGARHPAPYSREEGVEPRQSPCSVRLLLGFWCSESKTKLGWKLVWRTASHTVAMTPPPILLLHHSTGGRGEGWLKTQRSSSSFLTLFLPLSLSLSFHPFLFVSPSKSICLQSPHGEMMSSYVGVPAQCLSWKWWKFMGTDDPQSLDILRPKQ